MTPANWELRPLRYAVPRILSGTSVNGEDRDCLPGERRVLKLSSVRTGVFDAREYKVVSEADRDKVSTQARANTVLMSRKNTAGLVGANAFVAEDHTDLFLPDLLWQLVIDENRAVPKWLGLLLSTKDARRRIASTAAGTSGSMKGITKPSVLALEFYFPELKEQAAIVRVLDTAEEALRVSDALIELKVDYKHVLAEDLLTGRRRSAGFTAPWLRSKLDIFFAHKDDRSPTASPLILSCSKVFGILPQRELFSRQLASVSNAHYKHIVPGDLVYDPMLLWDASIAVSEYEGVVSPAYETLRWTGDDVGDRRFFKALFKSKAMKYVYTTISQGTNTRRRKAPVSDFLKINPKMPGKEEQRRIADLLDSLDDEIALLRNQRNAMSEQKKELMQKLLTGEVRLKEFRS